MDENPYKAPAEAEPKQRTRAWSVLFVLGVFVSLSPIFGMLMTTVGMVSAFNQIATTHEQPQPADLAGGIHNAIISTAVGLLVCPVGIVVTIVSAIKLWRRKPRA